MVSIGSDLRFAVKTLSKNFGVDSVPHIYVIKNGTVEVSSRSETRGAKLLKSFLIRLTPVDTVGRPPL